MGDSTNKPRRILHLDVDAMFVQCAVIADPERLADEKLIVVGGSPDGRGVVTSASYGCREFGVRSAMPMATALRLCPRAVVVRVPGDVVREKSRAIAAMLPGWTPTYAMASVDEAYLDMSGTEALYHGESLRETALRIQAEVKRETDLDVSLGGGTNRLVAKLATSFAKPAGVFVVQPGEEDAFVGKLEIADLIGIGPAFRESLRHRGITTMSALRALEVETMAQWWGEERARWLWRRCRGIDHSPIRGRERAKSVSSERTFSRDIQNRRELENILLAEVGDAAGSLRKQDLYARTITVKLRDSRFRDRSRSRTLREGVQTDRVIFSVARELLAELHDGPGGPYRLIGIGLTNLAPTPDGEQRSMLEVAPPVEGERERRLADAVDRIRGRHGKVISPGSVLGIRRGRDRDR